MSKVIKLQNVKLPVFIFKERDEYIAWTPALDISTCGESSKQVKRRFEEIVEAFFEEIIEMGTIDDVLKECGWKKVTKPKKRWIPPAIDHAVEEVKIPLPI
jgi:hypothetical protein